MLMWLRKPLPAALILVLLWTVCRLVCLRLTGIPQPFVQDEFSYILGADTFAHGRLANPPLPLGEFFQSPHIFVSPTYASKYPPGQAMFLALGEVLFGSPFFGVIIANAFMLFAFCLMLFEWVSPRWALAVSVMLALALSPGMYWTNSYWGGSVAASGSALVLLAIGRCRSKQTALAGIIFAIGGLLLFWTRPYEGGVFVLTVLAVFAKDLWQKRRAIAWAAGTLIFALGLVWTGYDNKAVTGSPFLLPHAVYQKRFQTQPVFWFQPLAPEPVFPNPRLAASHGINGWEAVHYHDLGTGSQRVWRSLLSSFWWLGLTLGVPVLLTLIVPVAWRDPIYRKMAIVTGAVVLALSAETFRAQHYAAPGWAALCLMIAIWVEPAWELRIHNLRLGKPLVLLALISPAIVVLLPHVFRTMQGSTGWVKTNGRNTPTGANWTIRRADLIRKLSHKDRDQLVIVRYPSPYWRATEEWVYNGADIDHQRVIFALDLGAEKDPALLEHYPDRTPLLLTFDSTTGQDNVAPYEGQ